MMSSLVCRLLRARTPYAYKYKIKKKSLEWKKIYPHPRLRRTMTVWSEFSLMSESQGTALPRETQF